MTVVMEISVDDKICLPNLFRPIGEEISSHILSTRRQFDISQHSPVPINTAICQKPSRSKPFPNTATTPVSIMSTHLSPSEPIMLHNRLNAFDVYRQHNQFTPSSPENSPTMSSFSKVGEDTSCPNSYSTKDPRFQRRIDNMQSYLDESTRLIQCPQPKDGTRPHEEARAIQDRSQPLPNLYNFEALLHGSGSETEEDSTSNSTTFDINQEMYSKCTLDKCDSATTDLDQELSIGTSEAQQYLPFEIGHTHGRMPEEPQSTGGRRPSASDSGFFDDSFSQESPLMESPETFFEDWPRVGVSVRQDLASPRTLVSIPIEETYIPGLGESPHLLNQTEAISPRRITERGFRMIMEKVLLPMMRDVNLSEFRQLLGQAVSELRQGIDIWCLRDLEKLILIKRGHLSEGCTATSYMKLCYEFLLRSSPLWDDKLSDLDLYRQADLRYYRDYLPDAMHEVKGIAQMVFQIRSEEIDNIMKSILQPVATTEVDGGRGQSKRDVPHSAGTGTEKLLKRQLSEAPDARRSRKKPKVCDNSSKPKASSERPSVSAAAGALDHTTGLITMQPPPLPSNQDTLLQQMVSTNGVPQPPPNYLTVDPPCDIDFISNSSFGTSDFGYGDFSIMSRMEYQQTKQSQSPIVSQVVHDGSTQNRFIPRSSSDSPSTVAQSDVSVSPGSVRRRNVPKQTEESHSCEKCSKRFPRACDLKKHRKTHDRPYKCTVPTCNYFTMGFSAEKDRDRHFHDKHDKDTPRHKCRYNCSYSSPRESNVKQHMEKAHGYVYVRTKTVQQKSKSAARTSSAKPTAQATTTFRQRRARRTSSPPQPPLSLASSVQTTPIIMEIEYLSSNDSPLFDIDTISPGTMKDELSPDMRPMQFFPPLPESPDSVIPTAIMFRNSDAQHDVYEHSPHTSTFSDPSEALEARRTQQISGVETPLFTVDGGHWNYMNPAARSDPHLGGDSPESEFANDFLRDAPSHVTDRLRPAAPIDPGLPVVDNSYYDAKRDVFFPME